MNIRRQLPRIALVADDLTCASLSHDAYCMPIGPIDYAWRLRLFRPDFLLVESAWSGRKNRWKYRIASYPTHPERNNRSLVRLVNAARNLGIPTVFWNKEDGVHFERFIGSAKLFDYIFTVDENMVPKYKSIVGDNASVHTLMFAIQPKTHGFNGFNFKYHRANFVGSYNRTCHHERRAWQDMIFSAACESGLGLTVVDRNAERKASVYRFPSLPDLDVFRVVPHRQTAQIYRDYLVSINVNTITDSPTMYSRRLVEILGCGGIAVTSPSAAVDELFKDYCHVAKDGRDARELFARLRYGPSSSDLERARAGAEYVAKFHTWEHRLEEIANVIGL